MFTDRNWVNFSSSTGRGEQGESGAGAHHQPGAMWEPPIGEVNEMITQTHEALLVGAADRYRLGELLIPHVLTRLLHFSKVRCAGLISADQTRFGGYATRNYGECLLELRGPRLKLVHFGGTNLATDLLTGYRGAVEGEEAERFESLSAISGVTELERYVRRRTGQLGSLAYVLDAEGEFWGAGTSFHAVGLPDPGSLPGNARESLLRSLRRSDFVGIRDLHAAEFLEREGIAVERMPCALSVLPQVCSRQLREAREREDLESIRRRFPNGWISVEVSGVAESDFERLSAALRETCDRRNLGLVFFEANRPAGGSGGRGVRRWVEAFPEWEAAEFPSSNLWDLAALILHSRLYCGSCLSSRILAMSGGVPRINVPTGTTEAQSYCELWEHDRLPIEFSREESWGDAIGEALFSDPGVLVRHANWLEHRYRQSFERFCRDTGIEPRLVWNRPVTPHERATAAMQRFGGNAGTGGEARRRFRPLSGRMPSGDLPKSGDGAKATGLLA